MPSLSRFKQRLSGEQPVKKDEGLDEWLKLVTEIEAEKQEQINDVQEIEISIVNVEPVAEEVDILIEPESMTKVELDEYAQEHGIHLDRRKSKQNMITEFIQKLKEKN